MTRIRTATPADTDQLVRMAEAFLRATLFGAVLKPVDDALAAKIAEVLETGVIFVGTDDGADDPVDRRQGPRLVGMIAGVLERTVTGDCIGSELVWWVDLAYRRTRLGPNLLRCLEVWTREKGGSVLKMVAPAGSSVGDYYARLGYTPIETAFIKQV